MLTSTQVEQARRAAARRTSGGAPSIIGTSSGSGIGRDDARVARPRAVGEGELARARIERDELVIQPDVGLRAERLADTRRTRRGADTGSA